MTSIVLGDDHIVFVESLVSVLIAEGFSVPAAVTSLTETIDAVRAHRPQICLLDRHFSDGDAMVAIDNVLAANQGTRVVILTADRDADAMRRAINVGATGFVHKTWGVRTLVEAINRVANGDIVMDAPRETGSPSLSTTPDRLAGQLTTRERECLGLLVEGLGTPAMTERLGVSATTVRSHVQAILTKLGAHSRLEAASLAVRYGLVDHH
jgi:two-component system, NarL family, nitrate/nitrite response regulator NarL